MKIALQGFEVIPWLSDNLGSWLIYAMPHPASSKQVYIQMKLPLSQYGEKMMWVLIP